MNGNRIKITRTVTVPKPTIFYVYASKQKSHANFFIAFDQFHSSFKFCDFSDAIPANDIMNDNLWQHHYHNSSHYIRLLLSVWSFECSKAFYSNRFTMYIGKYELDIRAFRLFNPPKIVFIAGVTFLYQFLCYLPHSYFFIYSVIDRHTLVKIFHDKNIYWISPFA